MQGWPLPVDCQHEHNMLIILLLMIGYSVSNLAEVSEPIAGENPFFKMPNNFFACVTVMDLTKVLKVIIKQHIINNNLIEENSLKEAVKLLQVTKMNRMNDQLKTLRQEKEESETAKLALENNDDTVACGSVHICIYLYQLFVYTVP